jgi:hypothetical protein
MSLSFDSTSRPTRSPATLRGSSRAPTETGKVIASEVAAPAS